MCTANRTAACQERVWSHHHGRNHSLRGDTCQQGWFQEDELTPATKQHWKLGENAPLKFQVCNPWPEEMTVLRKVKVCEFSDPVYPCQQQVRHTIGRGETRQQTKHSRPSSPSPGDSLPGERFPGRVLSKPQCFYSSATGMCGGRLIQCRAMNSGEGARNLEEESQGERITKDGKCLAHRGCWPCCPIRLVMHIH